ncbi:MAG: tetratricopeptide repeat protein, partial [Chloroflexi bacterium]
LRRLALSTPLSDLDAGVLKTILPDLDNLLGRSIPDAPALESRDARQRLVTTIAGVFRAQQRPVVLLLDDLQWASESLLPLREMARNIHELPLLVVGSYRDEERPDVPGELPGAQVINLERFSTEKIEELSASMLGDTGRQPHIVSFLERQTEGNAFFMVETLRALAEETGHLDAVVAVELPEHLFPEGIQAIAQRYLDRLPLDYHPLLRVAAVAGRTLDLNILRCIDPVVKIDRWLLVCSEAGILASDEGTWEFAHEKLRDGILFGLAEDQPRKLHRLVAEAIETIYPGNSEYYHRLAHHWREAEEPAKEAFYACRAGEQMMAVCCYPDALSLLNRALTLSDPNSPDTAALQIQRADVLYSLGDYGEAQHTLQAVLPTLRQEGDPALAAHAARILGQITQVSGDYHQARDLMQDSLELAQTAEDRRSEAAAIRNLGLIAENLGNLDEAVDLYQRSLSLFREVNQPMGIAGSLANLGSVAVVRADYLTAQAYFEEALALFEAVGFRWGYAYTLIRLGEIAFYQGDFERAASVLREALALCTEMGHRWGMAYSQIQLGHVTQAQDRPGLANQYFLRALQIARDLNAIPTVLDALTGAIGLLVRDEDYEYATELLHVVLAHSATEHDTRQRALRLLDSLAGRLAPDALHAAAQRGRLLDLDTALDALLAAYTAVG